MVKWRSKKLFKTSSKPDGGADRRREIQWELRPGGMLVQKREADEEDENKTMINVRISTGSRWHDITINATATFGELKVKAAMETGLEAREQRLELKGKEREDGEQLHMVGVKGGEKVLLLEDPIVKERLLSRGIGVTMKAMEIKATCTAVIAL